MVVIAIGFINFVAFFANSQRLGGDALNGYQANGHFYVSDHGRSTEVPESEWRINRLHAISIFVTHPLMLAAIFYLLLSDKFPKMMFRGQSEERERKEREVRMSGTPSVSFSCAGKIGTLRFGGPLLKVTVYSQGIHCKPILMPAFGILASEIQNISMQSSYLRKGVEITHTSSEVANPIFLYCSNNSVAVSALTSFKA